VPRINPDVASARALSHRCGRRAENENGLNGFVETALRSIRLARPRAGRKSFQPIPMQLQPRASLVRLTALRLHSPSLSLSLSLARSFTPPPSIYPLARGVKYALNGTVV
jgi:hypothetical protein